MYERLLVPPAPRDKHPSAIQVLWMLTGSSEPCAKLGGIPLSKSKALPPSGNPAPRELVLHSGQLQTSLKGLACPRGMSCSETRLPQGRIHFFPFLDVASVAGVGGWPGHILTFPSPRSSESGSIWASGKQCGTEGGRLTLKISLLHNFGQGMPRLWASVSTSHLQGWCEDRPRDHMGSVSPLLC